MAIYCKKYQNQVRDSKMFGKWYMKARSLRTVSTEELAEEISGTNTVTEADVKAVLSSLKVVMKQKLQAGLSVKLEGIGTFRTTVSCGPAEEEDKLTADNIKAIYVRFAPEKSLDLTTGKRCTKMLAGARIANIDDYAYEPKTKPAQVNP